MASEDPTMELLKFLILILVIIILGWVVYNIYLYEIHDLKSVFFRL